MAQRLCVMPFYRFIGSKALTLIQAQLFLFDFR
jgi:hypothetical protein